MSERDRIGRRNVRNDASSKRAGTSVLLAAVSLLGTSLGVSAATPVDPMAATAKNSLPRPTFDKLAEQAGGSVRRTQSNQLKIRSDQIKIRSNQVKIRSNQIKIRQ